MNQCDGGREGAMGILILGAVCTVGEGFLIYFLVHLVRDARREAQRLREAAKPNSDALQFALFEIAPPTERAVWTGGRWRHLDSSGEALPAVGRDDYWRAARRA